MYLRQFLVGDPGRGVGGGKWTPKKWFRLGCKHTEERRKKCRYIQAGSLINPTRGAYLVTYLKL